MSTRISGGISRPAEDVDGRLGHGEDTSESLEAIIGDLKRMCCSSEYMFIYSQALLSAVEHACGEAHEVTTDGWSSRKGEKGEHEEECRKRGREEMSGEWGNLRVFYE